MAEHHCNALFVKVLLANLLDFPIYLPDNVSASFIYTLSIKSALKSFFSQMSIKLISQELSLK